jgi:Family of unknown function (DUF5677)
MNNSNKSTLDLLKELQKTINDVSRGSISECGISGCALRASLVKSVEFAVLANGDDTSAHSFFITATLRGICEDLIVLTFLDKLSVEDRNRAMALLSRSELAESIEAQGEFFEAMRPWQPVIKPSNQGVSETESELRQISTKLGWPGKKPWPTVWFMAKAASLTAVYSYLYSATSKWVHFSPHVLLRMGWGGKPYNANDETEWIFTTANFAKYYTEFNQVHSLLLLLRLLRGPAAQLLPSFTEDTIVALQKRLDDVVRWPEAVTFEEMNVRGPGGLSRILMRLAYEGKEENKA